MRDINYCVLLPSVCCFQDINTISWRIFTKLTSTVHYETEMNALNFEIKRSRSKSRWNNWCWKWYITGGSIQYSMHSRQIGVPSLFVCEVRHIVFDTLNSFSTFPYLLLQPFFSFTSVSRWFSEDFPRKYLNIAWVGFLHTQSALPDVQQTVSMQGRMAGSWK